MNDSNDPFKVLYKKYRSTNCGEFKKLNNDSDLIDLNNLDQCESLVEEIQYDLNEQILETERFAQFRQSINLDEIKFYKLKKNEHNGLILISNVFKNDYTKELFDQLLNNLPNAYHSKLKSNIKLPINQDQIKESNLRWVTFGYHYDWTNKVYYENDFNETPPLIDDLLSCLKELFKLELSLDGGIINYYTCKSKLNAHSDCREKNLSAPLLSISLGEKALFLIGTNNRFDGPVTPIVLNNGDLMIMSKESRLAFHSVIKIVCDDKRCKRKCIKRININVRQVY